MIQPTNIQQNTDKLTSFISAKFEAGELDNDSLVQIIEHAGAYLNLATITAYAKENNISYNGAKKFRKTITLFGVKLVIDND